MYDRQVPISYSFSTSELTYQQNYDYEPSSESEAYYSSSSIDYYTGNASADEKANGFGDDEKDGLYNTGDYDSSSPIADIND